MAKLTILFGVILVAIGLGGFFLYGAKPHPAYSGVALVVCGLLANTENTKRRMLWMHIAVLVGLVSFLVPAIRSTIALAGSHAAGAAVMAPWALHEQLLVALVSLVYVVLCVRSFIAARRTRTA